MQPATRKPAPALSRLRWPLAAFNRLGESYALPALGAWPTPANRFASVTAPRGNNALLCRHWPALALGDGWNHRPAPALGLAAFNGLGDCYALPPLGATRRRRHFWHPPDNEKAA